MHPSQLSASIEAPKLGQDTGLQTKLAIATKQTSHFSEQKQRQRNALIEEPLASAIPNSSRLLNLPLLTLVPPLSTCRVSVIIPARNEAENLPAVIGALACQVDDRGRRLDPDLYEVLILANNCTDSTVGVAERLSDRYPFLQLQTIDVALPQEVAFVGKARQMAMDEAYRRLSLAGLDRRIIASTDGDTQVASNWIHSLLAEFHKGIDAVGGRIITRRADQPEISARASLYYLRRVAHAYLSSQIECLIDPQTHDCWPRHFQFCGANMAVSAQIYAQVGGMPLVRDEEDVALYRRLQQTDAKIRHSLNVRVSTSARQVGRATGGLSELLTALSDKTQQAALVESPVLTEARMVMRKGLRQVWAVLQGSSSSGDGNSLKNRTCSFNVRDYAKTTELLARSLGVPVFKLRSHIENAVTFGALVTALFGQQLEHLPPDLFESTTEISLANMHLRQRLNGVRQQAASVEKLTATSEQLQLGSSSQVILKALQQVQAIPLFPPAY